jgi:hypothetical protein
MYFPDGCGRDGRYVAAHVRQRRGFAVVVAVKKCVVKANSENGKTLVLVYPHAPK